MLASVDRAGKSAIQPCLDVAAVQCTPGVPQHRRQCHVPKGFGAQQSSAFREAEDSLYVCVEPA